MGAQNRCISHDLNLAKYLTYFHPYKQQNGTPVQITIITIASFQILSKLNNKTGLQFKLQLLQ